MLKYVVAILAILLLVATLAFGFPGVWALLGLVPAFIIGATVAHVRRPRPAPGAPGSELPGAHVRPGVVVLGGLFGLASGAGTMIVWWAAAASPTISVSAERVVDAPLTRVWGEIVDPYRRTAWDLWIADLEPIGKAATPIVGAEYRSVLRLERIEVPATQTITELVDRQTITWAITPQGGSTLENMRQTMTVEARGPESTLVRFTLSYEVPTVMGRVGERIAVRGAVERMTEETLGRLRNVATGLE